MRENYYCSQCGKLNIIRTACRVSRCNNCNNEFELELALHSEDWYYSLA